MKLEHLPENWRDVLTASEGVKPSPSNIARLGKQFGEDVASWAFTQWEIRGRAASKFSRASEMLFTRPGYEMATSERVAEFHASLFPPGVHVHDLTCGIGADLIALAGRGPAVGIDLSPIHVECARHNLDVYGVSASVELNDALIAGAGAKYVFVDPARRDERKRTVNPEEFSPSFSALEPILRGAELAVMKISPMVDDRWLDGVEAQVIVVSYEFGCPEILLVFGQGAGRSVVRVESGSRLTPIGLAQTVDEPAQYLYEADAAVIRGGALGAIGLPGLADSNGYLTSDERVGSEWVRGFEVLWHGAWRPKDVTAAARKLDGQIEVVKTRGVRVSPAEAKAQVKAVGPRRLTLVLYRLGEKVRACLVEPL
ncbi:MAG: hypothetical protein KDC26_10345 [Armatimonadetes bacterium]|nr:hypothetical protein [Armatimonadota bacterium]